MTSDLWTKKYEPKTLSDMIGQTELVNAFKEYVKTKHIPNMTIAGAPGIGKTLLMKCFAHDLGFSKFEDDRQIDVIPGQFYLMNASSDRGIETVRTTIKRLAQKPTMHGMPRLIVLDEFNYTEDAQNAMRALMEDCTDNVRFILLSNDPSNIIDPIISRCPIKFAKPLTIEDMKTLVSRIQENENFKITDDAIKSLYNICKGDIRKFIGKLQDACIISNYNIEVHHTTDIDTDIATAKSIIESALNDYNQAREIMLTTYMKTKDAKALLQKMFDATLISTLSQNINDNEIMKRRLCDRISETDYRLTQGTNPTIQLDALINYIRLLKLIPLHCPKVK